MAWLRIDDGFAQHPKIVALAPKDRWTWLELLCYCARYRTDGHVPPSIGEVVRGCTPAFLARCGQLRLLDDAEGSADGFLVHDWAEYNPATVAVEDLEERVARALEERPDASATEIARVVGGRKQAVLETVRRFRTGSHTGSAGNQGTGLRAGTRARTRPVPSQTTSSDVPGDPAATPDDDLRLRLEHLGVNGRALTNAIAEPDRANAWLDYTQRHANGNAAGYFATSFAAGEWPPADTTTKRVDYEQRARELYERTHDDERVADWLAGLTISVAERERILATVTDDEPDLATS